MGEPVRMAWARPMPGLNTTVKGGGGNDEPAQPGPPIERPPEPIPQPLRDPDTPEPVKSPPEQRPPEPVPEKAR